MRMLMMEETLREFVRVCGKIAEATCEDAQTRRVGNRAFGEGRRNEVFGEGTTKRTHNLGSSNPIFSK